MLLSFETALFFSKKISFVASIACTFVLVLLFVKPPKNVGNYRYCYYILASLECVSAIAHYFGAPCFFVNGNTFLTFPLQGSMIAHITWMTAYHAFEIMLTSFFIYRYGTVCRINYILAILKSKRLFAAAMIFLIVNIIMMTTLFYVFYIPTGAIKTIANQLLHDSTSIDFEQQFVAGFDYPIGHPYMSVEIVQIAHILSTVLSVFFVATMTKCAFLMYSYVKKNAFSAKQSKQHNRVLMLLAQQAIVPFCFVYSLALSCEVSILIRADISFTAPIFTLTTSIPPLCSCLSVIGLTSEYRRMFVLTPNQSAARKSKITLVKDYGVRRSFLNLMGQNRWSMYFSVE